MRVLNIPPNVPRPKSGQLRVVPAQRPDPSMDKSGYPLLTGRILSLEKLTIEEREVLHRAREQYSRRPTWNSFGAWWLKALTEAGVGPGSPVTRVCEDLEARLGIAEGKVAVPDYRDYLADLIEERYGSRNRFCKNTGVDPGHLSRVFASRADLSLQTLSRVLEALDVVLVIRPREAILAEASPERAREALAVAR